MSDKLEALKAKKPGDTKSLKSQAAGYVTDDNSGGYFVVECLECGEIYPSQESAGGGQIADTGDYDDSYCPHCGQVDPDECDNVGLVWNVQQAKINALLAALEEANKQLSGEELVSDMTRDSAKYWKQRANAAEQREEHLKADAAVMGKRIAKLESVNEGLSLRLFVEIEIEACNDKIITELQRQLQQPMPKGFSHQDGALHALLGTCDVMISHIKWADAQGIAFAPMPAGKAGIGVNVDADVAGKSSDEIGAVFVVKATSVQSLEVLKEAVQMAIDGFKVEGE